MKALSNTVVIVALSLATAAIAQVPAGQVVPNPVPAQAATPDKPTLGVGSPAPAIKVSKWFKGTSVTEFKEGQVYVMEFWATWCGPCIAAMPHVTELAKKYQGKATVIGVSVWERPPEKTDTAIADLVGSFVEKQGDRMGYNVAAEGADGFMADTWLRAAGQDGIPCTMIVGKDKKIAWIGHPMEMDKPLEEIVAGTFDVKAEMERQAREREKQQAQAALLNPIRQAMAANDPKGVSDAIDKAVAQMPEMESMLFPVKFEALVKSDEAAAFAYLKKWFEGGAVEKEPVNGYNAYVGLSRNVSSVKNPDWKLMAQVLEKVNALRGKKDPQILAANADAYFHAGDKAKALEYQQQAVTQAESAQGVPATWLETQKKKLDEYKAAK
jgi:thiol-disulfide isomerase/thioredoxin